MGIEEKARDLGNALARTDEYQALKRAMDAADEDRELVELRNRLEALEQRLEASMRAGQEPEEGAKKAYTDAAEELQVKAGFQRLICSFAPAASSVSVIFFFGNSLIRNFISRPPCGQTLIPTL